jgi:ABC-type branched-subunit amino acid transport system ATPase component
LERFRRPTKPLPEGRPTKSRDHLPAESSGLAVDGLRVRFGGITAVNMLTFNAPMGRVTGLIGRNGARKTTTFDAFSGLNRRIDGTVRLHDRDVTRLGPAPRGRAGLGRTFQRMQLGDSLTVVENVPLGREAALAGGNPLTQLAPRNSGRTRCERRTRLSNSAGRLGDPERDIGRAIAMLVKDDMGFLTGATIMLDGGTTLLR